MGNIVDSPSPEVLLALSWCQGECPPEIWKADVAQFQINSHFLFSGKDKNLLWAEVAELYLGCHKQGANHHEGEHVEAHVVVPLALVQVASDDEEDIERDGDDDGGDEYEGEHGEADIED